MNHVETAHKEEESYSTPMERRIIFRQAINLLNWHIHCFYSHFHLHFTPTTRHISTLVIWTMGPRVWRVSVLGAENSATYYSYITRHCWWVDFLIFALLSQHRTFNFIFFFNATGLKTFSMVYCFRNSQRSIQQFLDNAYDNSLFCLLLESQEQSTF